MTDNLPSPTAPAPAPAPAGELATQMRYAQAVASAGMLPDAYRGQPANVLLAVGLGASMGLSPAESLYRISVIKGKPTAGAELIAANVRKAGHKLRVRGDDTSATAQIIRADDPDYTFEVTRDMAWAQKMGLADAQNYRKQPGTMLQWRAITAVARLACPEALYGVTYTADEMFDMQGGRGAPPVGDAPAEEPPAPEPEPAEEVPVEPEPDEPDPRRKRKRMFALFSERGIPDDQQLPGINHRLGTDYESRSQVTEADAEKVIEYLTATA